MLDDVLLEEGGGGEGSIVVSVVELESLFFWLERRLRGREGDPNGLLDCIFNDEGADDEVEFWCA